jgi:IS30 family transposase
VPIVELVLWVVMGKSYNQLSLEERDRITELTRQECTVTGIAEALGRSKATISRELRRNSTPAYKLYLSHRAHERAVKRKREAGERPKLKSEEVVSYVRAKLTEDWSPELIAGRLSEDVHGMSISHEAIYQYIYHPKTEGRSALIACLTRRHRKRKTKGTFRKERKTKIPNRVPIHERPVSADNRSRYGHWEGDSLVSRKSTASLNSLVERKSRYLKLSRMDRKTAELTNTAIVRRLGALPKKARRTLTLDNGTENAGHEEITKTIGVKCYFADPYASWQKGAVESVNALIRRYFPKGTDFGKITDAQVAWVESRINNRPRKCLGYKTPAEVASVALRC